jgi:hypothetical protein
MPIDQALQTISDNGLGKDFLIWSIEKTEIAVKAFTWVSYDDYSRDCRTPLVKLRS